MESSNTWKWSDGTETPIETMDLKSCLKAALHCMKRMRYYSDQVRFFEYKLDVARTKEDKSKAETNIKRCSDSNLLFADKLEQLSTRTHTLGTPIPSKFEGIKSILAEKFPRKRGANKSQSPKVDKLKEKAEKVNQQQEEEVNAYF